MAGGDGKHTTAPRRGHPQRRPHASANSAAAPAGTKTAAVAHQAQKVKLLATMLSQAKQQLLRTLARTGKGSKHVGGRKQQQRWSKKRPQSKKKKQQRPRPPLSKSTPAAGAAVLASPSFEYKSESGPDVVMRAQNARMAADLASRLADLPAHLRQTAAVAATGTTPSPKAHIATTAPQSTTLATKQPLQTQAHVPQVWRLPSVIRANTASAVLVAELMRAPRGQESHLQDVLRVHRAMRLHLHEVYGSEKRAIRLAAARRQLPAAAPAVH